MVVLLGGVFFAYLLFVFAVWLLVFICAFMLSSGVLLIAVAYAYKLLTDATIKRERHTFRMARDLREGRDRPSTGPGD